MQRYVKKEENNVFPPKVGGHRLLSSNMISWVSFSISQRISILKFAMANFAYIFLVATNIRHFEFGHNEVR